jgi:hypothetical protein
MKVYVVEHGEKFEGGQIIGVYTTYEKAKFVALSQEPVFDGGWIADDCGTYRYNGCDYVNVKEFEVEE